MKQIFQGWQQCYYHFLSWWYLLQDPYNHFTVWEFFTYLNPDADEPYVIRLSEEDYDALMKRLDEPSEPSVIESLKEFMSKPSPWD